MIKLFLKPDKEKSLLRGHPWIFSGAIANYSETPIEGNVVEVCNHKGKHLAFGHYQNNTITVRILTVDGSLPDINFFKLKLQNAWKLRNSLGLANSNETTIFRLVHGEGDFLSGLIIDYYDGNLVIQCHSIGMYLATDIIVESLKEIVGKKLKSIYQKSSSTLPPTYTDYKGDGYVYGKQETPIVAKEYNNLFKIDWVTGQKTGFFIDQRENRKLLAQYALNKKILNTFCYSGGFSVFALNSGAISVHSLDSSKKAIELTDENIALISKEKIDHQSIVADTMNFIKDIPEDYDIIVLDPPAFAKHKSAKHNAVQGYKRLNAQAIKQIKAGGIIFTFSCSQIIDKELFTNTIIAASIEAKRNVRILNQLHQPADHPINVNHPEGEYLKGLVIQVD